MSPTSPTRSGCFRTARPRRPLARKPHRSVQGPIEEFELADAPVAPGPVSPSPVGPRGDRRPVSEAGWCRPPAPAVDQVWSRTARVGTDAAGAPRLGGRDSLAPVLRLGAELYGLAALIFGVGCLGAVLLSYPLLITLERPVRITPGAGRAGLLRRPLASSPPLPPDVAAAQRPGPGLSPIRLVRGIQELLGQAAGASSASGHAGRFSPLVFKVEEFRAEKSAGKTEIDARFKVKVLVRGRQAEGPIWSLPAERSFVRGPDGMWYLNDGTLAERTRASTEESLAARRADRSA